ncbi:hypothetical protein VULLAG_LOCUS11285 [Vulpes lagopus]
MDVLGLPCWYDMKKGCPSLKCGSGSGEADEETETPREDKLARGHRAVLTEAGHDQRWVGFSKDDFSQEHEAKASKSWSIESAELPVSIYLNALMVTVTLLVLSTRPLNLTKFQAPG